MKKTINIKGMSCGHCSAAVEKELNKLSGVSQVQVSLEKQQATLEAADTVTDAMLRDAVDEAGYDVVSIQ